MSCPRKYWTFGKKINEQGKVLEMGFGGVMWSIWGTCRAWGWAVIPKFVGSRGERKDKRENQTRDRVRKKVSGDVKRRRVLQGPRKEERGLRGVITEGGEFTGAKEVFYTGGKRHAE